MIALSFFILTGLVAASFKESCERADALIREFQAASLTINVEENRRRAEAFQISYATFIRCQGCLAFK
jgi:hypothetical protein